MRKLDLQARQQMLVQFLEDNYGTNPITFAEVHQMAVMLGYAETTYGKDVARMLVKKHGFRQLPDGVQLVEGDG